MTHAAIALLDRALADRQRYERDRDRTAGDEYHAPGNPTQLYNESERWDLVRQARAALAEAEPILRWYGDITAPRGVAELRG